ncbi:MAG: maleylpyruvate isomerase N-terminal domain-containing protein [Streptosporangiaceae bacterium]
MIAATQAGELLEQAVGYARESVAVVTPDLLDRPTPCRDWDLAMLLRHGCESLAAL